MASRRSRVVALAAGAVTGGLLASAGPAAASEAPRCWDSAVWARPGLTRSFELYCPRAERIELVSEPARSRFEGLVRGESFRFRLTPEADAPQRDSFRVRLTGLGGSREQDIAMTNVALSDNSAPVCAPVSVAQRTAGTAPVTLSFHVECTDAEHDDFTLHGGGPGTHPGAPLLEEGGLASSSNSPWSYRPTIASGDEQTTYHAVDVLGARSADAPIGVRVGPTVDRLAQCYPNPGTSGFAFLPVRSRPGATRRFSLICKDADDDPVRARIAAQPSRGELTLVAPALPARGELWLDATYTPRTTYEGSDPFSVIAGGPLGDAPATAMGIVSVPLPSNSGGGCGWSPGQTRPGIAVTLEITCTDNEGDPYGAKITSPPEHGEAAVPQIVASAYGAQRVRIAYRPQAGFEGVDGVTVEVRDEGGDSTPIDIDVVVRETPPPAPPVYAIGMPYDWPELRPQAPSGPTWQPSVGQARPVSPLDQARSSLGTRAVRLVKRIGDARVYTPRATLAATPRRRALAVTCPVRCAVTSSSTVAGRSAGDARLRIEPGRAGALVLALTPAQRGRVRRARRGRASFRLTVARAGRTVRSATVRLSLRG